MGSNKVKKKFEYEKGVNRVTVAPESLKIIKFSKYDFKFP